MSLMMLAFWGLLAWVVVVLVRDRDHNVQSVSPRPPSPEEIVAERFARGEIDADEYRERLEALRGHPRQAGT
jgi:putative membrane protein